MLTAVQTEYPIGKQNQLLLSEIRQQLFVLTFEAERKRLADNTGLGRSAMTRLYREKKRRATIATNIGQGMYGMW